MKQTRVRSWISILFLLFASLAWAQQNTIPDKVKAEDPNDELGKLRKNCFQHVVGCAEVLFTGQPLHIAVGSIAPQNGIGVGLAFVHHTIWSGTNKDGSERDQSREWNADAVASPNGSWRAGIYYKLVPTTPPDIGIEMGTRGAGRNRTSEGERPVTTFYAQSIQLNQINYFGLGSTTQESARSFYGMRETIAGASRVQPLNSGVPVNLYGEANARWVEIRGRHGESSPSIEQLYNEASAPGLSEQPFFLQLGAGVRFYPTLRDDLFHLNYDLNYRPYFALRDSHFNFQKFTASLSHQMSLYRNRPGSVSQDTNGPNNCSTDISVKNSGCPKVSTRNVEGTIGVTFVSSLSMTQGNGVVPFYFQPTLGGGDVNGKSSLSSYQDYRFRAPDYLLFRESFEHSIWRLPVGFVFVAEQGNLALRPSDLGSTGWKHSYSTGLTLRAGGFPMVYLLFSWGGREGTHFTGTINNSLLGGSARPSLF